jgi:hypothetical protein
MKKTLIILAFSLCWARLSAQEIIGVSARYDDSYREWDIYDDSEALIGEFVQRWQQNDDWKEWDLRFADGAGSVRQKWRTDPSRWELRFDGETISIKMHYPNDPNHWIITNDRISLEYSTRVPYQSQEWRTTSAAHGNFKMLMMNENDPRDWEVFDELHEDISPAMRLATIFITLLVSCPRQ